MLRLEEIFDAHSFLTILRTSASPRGGAKNIPPRRGLFPASYIGGWIVAVF